jgi:hypothetical protein
MNWNKIATAALYAQAIVATCLALGMVAGKIPPSDVEPINGRKVAAFALGFAVTLIIIARQRKNNIRLLLIPIVVTAVNLVDTLFEFGVRGDYLNFIPPMIIEPVFLLVYIICYVKLSSTTSMNA